MVDERIMTLHPEEGKQGVNIRWEKYDTVREAILNTIRRHGKITFNRMMEEVNRQLSGRFEGSISWYVTTVKLDLEARGLIERMPKSSPQQLRLAGGQEPGNYG